MIILKTTAVRWLTVERMQFENSKQWHHTLSGIGLILYQVIDCAMQSRGNNMIVTTKNNLEQHEIMF